VVRRLDHLGGQEAVSAIGTKHLVADRGPSELVVNDYITSKEGNRRLHRPVAGFAIDPHIESYTCKILIFEFISNRWLIIPE
jgi:hypothetical protein